jgi:8-oxo-dGTP pyrophosphatase MutT (NUDIX family)
VNWTPELRACVHANLRGFPRLASDGDGRRAAVAIVLLEGRRGEAALPLFRRASRLRRHPGQMGLLGGVIDGAEDAVGAAVRELSEELGITADRDQVIGALDDFETRSGFVITPIVLWSEARGRELRPAAAEIERLYLPSLRELEAAAASAPPGPSPEFGLAFEWGTVYAPTAAILYQFNEVALHGRSCRVGDFHQPRFTWR